MTLGSIGRKVNTVPKVMVIGTSEISSRVLASLLKEAGFEITMLYDGSHLTEFTETLPSAVIVEEGARREGWQLGAEIRRKSNVPIILLGSGNAEVGWVKAAAYGIDLYVAWPFSSRELAARIKTLIRRYEGTIRQFVDVTRGAAEE